MATDVKPTPTQLEPALESLLGRLRRRVRAYVVLDGVAAAVVALCLGFWSSLVVDWCFELPQLLRAVALVVVAASVGYIVFRLLVARLSVRLADRNMALLLERRFGQFHDGLLTAVELAERPDHATSFSADMLRHTRRTVLADASDIELTDVFNTAPLARRVTLALALAGSALLFAFAVPDTMAVWTRRNLLMSPELWPRNTHLFVEGFGDDGRVKIARGADWVLRVKADAALERVVPEVVLVRYSTTDGARGRENMSREGVVLPGQAPFQHYAHTFTSVLAPLEFYVAGGDDREGPYYLDVVESPTISRMTFHCEYPPYMRRAPRDIPVAGLMQLPRGTQITIHAAANKPLVAVQIDDVTDENAAVTERLDIAAENGAPADTFSYCIPRFDADKILLFTLFDADGIRSLEAVRLAISAVADEPPGVNVQLQGIGTAITPAARLPVAGEVSDDYGIAKIWFDFHADAEPSRQQPFAVVVDSQESLAVADALEVGPLALEPKQKFHLAVQAADGCALDSGANVGSGQRYVLDVVTPEQLRSMLEARELMLRRRFETIIEEFTDTRNLLAGIESSVDQPDPPPDGADDAQAKPPADEPQVERTEKFSRHSVQVARVSQNVERSEHETLAVADAFDEIRAEMVNNRVDTEELEDRLKEGVADPLRRIIADEFPLLQTELEKLSAEVSNPQASDAAQKAAVVQMDVILVEMRQVLDKMLELETFNEVLDILRQIIEEQEKVNAQTKDKQKQKLRDLIE